MKHTFIALVLSLSAPWVATCAEPDDTNYDESKVGVYTLPDPLVCFDGRRVTDATVWREIRRPEILDSFAANVYGRTPPIPIHLRFETTDIDAEALGGLATRKQVTIQGDRTLTYVPTRTCSR